MLTCWLIFTEKKCNSVHDFSRLPGEMNPFKAHACTQRLNNSHLCLHACSCPCRGRSFPPSPLRDRSILFSPLLRGWRSPPTTLQLSHHGLRSRWPPAAARPAQDARPQPWEPSLGGQGLQHRGWSQIRGATSVPLSQALPVLLCSFISSHASLSLCPLCQGPGSAWITPFPPSHQLWYDAD